MPKPHTTEFDNLQDAVRRSTSCAGPTHALPDFHVVTRLMSRSTLAKPTEGLPRRAGQDRDATTSSPSDCTGTMHSVTKFRGLDRNVHALSASRLMPPSCALIDFAAKGAPNIIIWSN